MEERENTNAESLANLDQRVLVHEEDDDFVNGSLELTDNWNKVERNHNNELDLNDQLEEFRQQWQKELRQQIHTGSQSQRPRENQNEIAHNKSKQNSDIENEARAYFMQGMQAEDDGLFNEAIYYYRKALQLVPDIEFRIGSMLTKVPGDRVRQDSECSVEGKEMEEDLLAQFEKLRVTDKTLCLPEYEQRMVHISSLPVELIIYILHWVVSTDLDFRSLEMFSLVCRGFYTCARDERIWKKACENVWGVNLGSCKKYGSWRRMIIDRPHLLFDGCYVSKTSYIRQGEQSLDSFYRPFHLVEYFRYVRFFPDGVVLMLVSPEDPLQSLPKLKIRNSKTQGMLKGVYKLIDHKVTCILKRVVTETVSNRYRRHRQVFTNEMETTYTVEFDVIAKGRRPNAQLVWCNYSVCSLQKSTNQESISTFALNKKSFPSLIFSRVRNYAAVSNEPLA
ncbi:F-box only protein 9 [Bulinus truncatus]|nr:F-box only protein 9 [Bulinus truncatus]